MVISLNLMEVDTQSSCSNEKQPSTCSVSSNDEKNPPEKGGSSPEFTNHAAIAWHESRREWIGDSSKRLQGKPKDPVINWTTTYEDLLSTTVPFTEPISLTSYMDTRICVLKITSAHAVGKKDLKFVCCGDGRFLSRYLV